MAFIVRALAGPSGPFFIWIILLFLLFAAPGSDEAIIIGMAIGQLTDPIVLIVSLVTALAASRWWHVCIAGVIVGLYEALRPRYFETDVGMITMSVLAAFFGVAVLAAIGAGIRRLASRRSIVAEAE